MLSEPVPSGDQAKQGKLCPARVAAPAGPWTNDGFLRSTRVGQAD